MLLHFCQFSSEECYWFITLSYDCTKLFRQGVGVYLKFFLIIWVSQYYISCDSSFYVVKHYLMHFIPVSCRFLGVPGSGDFRMTTLSYQGGKWGKHFTTSCSKISVVLDHAQETTEVFDLLWRCYCEYCLSSLRLWLNTSPCEDIP